MKKIIKSGKIFLSVVVSSLDKKGIYYQMQASKDECTSLCERFDIPAISDFKSEIHLFRDDFVHVKGKIDVQMKRQSVVSLREFDQTMTEEFDALFSEEPPTDTKEIIDEIYNGRIDLGAVLAEQFGLALDPFPHAPDENETYVYSQPDEDVSDENPFKDLKKIMKK